MAEIKEIKPIVTLLSLSNGVSLAACSGVHDFSRHKVA